jgi:hypothetical protein
MWHTSRNPILLLALLFMAGLGFCGRAFASSTATTSEPRTTNVATVRPLIVRKLFRVWRANELCIRRRALNATCYFLEPTFSAIQ